MDIHEEVRQVFADSPRERPRQGACLPLVAFAKASLLHIVDHTSTLD